MAEDNKSTAVEKFDPSTLMDGVKSRIKATFVSMIPDDAWEEMCKVEMDKFFKPRRINRGSTSYPDWRESPSEFEEIVITQMKEKAKEFVSNLLSDPKYKIETTYAYNVVSGQHDQKLTPSEHLDKMMTEQMPSIMNAMMTGLLTNGIQQMFNSLRNQQVIR